MSSWPWKSTSFHVSGLSKRQIKMMKREVTLTVLEENPVFRFEVTGEVEFNRALDLLPSSKGSWGFTHKP